MSASKLKNLSSLFRSAYRVRKQRDPASSSAAADAALKQYVFGINVSTSDRVLQNLRNFKSPKPKLDDSSDSAKHSSDISIDNLKLYSAAGYDESSAQLGWEILNDDLEDDEDRSLENVLDLPWFPNKSNNIISLRRKEISRERKQKFIYKNSQKNRFDQLVKLCGEKLGSDATIEVFGKLGRVTGPKEFNAVIRLCIETARNTDDDEVSLQQIVKAYKIFESVKEQGFQIKEETYGPFLMYLIDNGMVREFHFFCDLIRDETLYQRLAYYELLLLISVNHEDKIQELLYNLAIYDGEDKSSFQENYLLAFCERGRRKELLLLLETFDITKVSSTAHAVNIFRSLGKLMLESFAERFLMALKVNDGREGQISSFIYSYVTSIPNLVVEDAILRFKNMHAELELRPTSVQYEKFIQYCCKSSKVHVALDIVEEMLEAGSISSLDIFHSLLDACEGSCEYNLVHRIYSIISHHGLKPNCETFRSMINLCVKMKDFEGAYGMIADLEKMNLMPTPGIYNAIMAGYFREKNIRGALLVLRQMENADVKPDSQTFSYLLFNCYSEDVINKIFDEMKHSGVQPTKHIFMALINAYAACGQFERAKQVVLDKQVPVKSLNEIKSVLVSALASHGEIKDALDLYEEIKQGKCSLEPKAIVCLIEHLQSEGELNRLLQLLEELHDPDFWMDGCFRVVSYCVHHEHLRPAIDLLKQLKDKVNIDEVAAENFLDEVFCQIAEKEPTDMQFGLNLLRAIKEELGVRPSRKNLDFLLTACVNANDLKSCFLIWKEYQEAELPYNVLSFLRMYQALLALGDHKSATEILNKIPKDDPHVICVIKACKETFVEAALSSTGGKKKKKKKARGET